MIRITSVWMVVVLGSGCLDPAEDGNLVPVTADQDATIPQLAFNGSTFHLETAGDPANPVVILLHGGPGGDYRSLLRLLDPVDGRRLTDDYFVVLWDQRGSGLSQRHDAAELDLATYDADLDWLVDHYSADRPVVLIGHSWGGMYATSYISEHPEQVAGAVLMEPGPLTGALFDEVKDEIIKLAFFSEWLNDYAWAHRVLSPDDHARADYLRALGMLSDAQPGYHQSDDDPSPIWRLGAVANTAVQEEGMVDGKPAWDFTTGLATFTTPVLFIASSDNTVIGEAFQRRQQVFYPNATMSVIADSGHDHPWTHAAQTMRPVFTYLDQLGL